MDNLDIYELEEHVKVIVTIGELRGLYIQGWNDGNWDSTEHDPVIVKGEIV